VSYFNGPRTTAAFFLNGFNEAQMLGNAQKLTIGLSSAVCKFIGSRCEDAFEAFRDWKRATFMLCACLHHIQVFVI